MTRRHGYTTNSFWIAFTKLRNKHREMSAEYSYVYILSSIREPERHYTGCTTDLKARLEKHNKGDVSHTAKNRPWKIETAISFSCKDKARAFEKYLKSGSGREFARRHF